MSARPWYREPLLHFAVLGVALFGLFRVVGPADEGETIVVSAQTRERIGDQQQRKLGRPPTDAELDAAIRSWADAEMLYREARALGLDRADPIVRRRLTQKLQFSFEEAEEPPEPTDAELEAWIAEHSDRFQKAPRVAFTHVFVESSSRVVPEAELGKLEAALSEGADPATLGQPFVLGQVITARSAAELNRQFGPGFGDAAIELPELGWHRVRSLYGWHLVHVDERLPGGLASVDEARSQAREGLRQAAREQARERAMAELRERYQVVIE
ncbi:MAG TPA: peptidylprolyl isomerase [Enhygromyxa sp.]|nr:peptidylprolyl isomerase [Enhygromyxa sp.]